ncbi:SMC-Scp complex subunit ScpB [Bacillus altitudinis MN12]|jgi:segregation and condensation protein B|uniref:Segregation and condensation protein B n=3 Tax=Bacillus TaxID=1386 RepID=A0ABV1S4X3_BACAB|nr:MULTISPECIES: SMC-Scp complex subunit ScpB [Bacillus]AHL71920.1 segregation and condensation protein B [Bacillus pumilus]KML00112.1 segregation and condensation protein B [Bacillus stratosphericus]KQL38530.1 segregation and condensation protein B [Bacillus sp. FJAT-21955]MBW3700280.1 SMC-Scp complex subunit ScpB [Bacillus aerophilus]MDH8710835.1 segregation and condensation protein B [Micromonospora sp. 1209]CVM13936.1 segregation and condensation protein B [Streptococcus pneumoniae]
MTLDIVNWKAILEALLYAAGDEGLTRKQLMSVLEVDEAALLDIMSAVKEEYQKQERGIELIEYADSYMLLTKKEYSVYLKKLVETPSKGLSQAALEVLAIVSYKQPITRSEVEEIRGVKSERVLHSLVAKALLCEVGRADGPGRAILYGTTPTFLEQFGLKALDELPPLPENVEADGVQEEADLFFENFNQTFEEIK